MVLEPVVQRLSSIVLSSMAASDGLGPSVQPDVEPLDSGLPLDNIITYAYQNGKYILVSYGWHILLGLGVAALVWTNAKPAILRWWRKRERMMEEAHFDPVKAEQFQDGMMRAREKMQQDLDKTAQEHQAAEEQKTTEARDERIKQWEEFKVVTKSKTTSRSKKPNHFPLDGHGGGSSYRPPRRTIGGTGGGG